MLILKPSVYLIGRPYCDRDEIQRFLNDHGHTDTDFATDFHHDADQIAATGGKICYDSFSSGRPVEEYLPHIIESKHYSVLEHNAFTVICAGVSRSLCYLPGTEVLTNVGWRAVETLGEGDILLTKCPQTGLCRWSKNKRLLSMPYDGWIHWFQGSEWQSPGITSNHLVWAARYDLREFRGMSCREIADVGCRKVPFTAVEGKRLVVDHAIRCEGEDADTLTIGDRSYPAVEFYEWLGWCLTDGGAAKHRKACYVTQTKPAGWSRIAELMDVLFPGRWKGRSAAGEHHTARIHDAALWEYVVSNFGRLKKDRRLCHLFTLSRRLQEAFLRGVVGGDGSVHKSSGHVVVYCNNTTVAGDLQVLFSMCGKSGCVRVFSEAGRAHGEYVSNQPEVLVSVHTNTASLIRADQQHKLWYTGPVYCPETEDGLVYVRRRGHGVWSGNTHEFVRHRHFGYSEQSQRYVLCPQRFVVPPLMIPHDDLVTQWYRDQIKQHGRYVELVKDLRHRGLSKKEAHGAARSLLPEATETRIQITGNIRSWRDMAQQRISADADAEIHRLASTVLDTIRPYTTMLEG